jgi:hypothetical protein
MLLCSALSAGLLTGSSADPVHRVLRAGVSSCRSSPCAHRALISFSTCFPYRFPSCPACFPVALDRSASSPSVMVCPGFQAGKGTKLAGRRQANPGRAVRARTPGAAAPVRSTPSRDAGTRPGPAASRGGQGRCRPRPPPGVASWTSPRVPCSQHRCVPGNSPAQAAQIARSLHPSLPRHQARTHVR